PGDLARLIVGNEDLQPSGQQGKLDRRLGNTAVGIDWLPKPGVTADNTICSLENAINGLEFVNGP
ncbi:MAG TPA: hypothetical protein VNJ31_04825, partial [Methyloceanibacter sp.]|nr:hypothetical protein [Methyloceanibacter sp.]